MERYWYAELEDGSVVTEMDVKWSELDLAAVRQLGLRFDGRSYLLPSGKRDWFQAKTASVSMAGGNAVVESRHVGFREQGREYILRISESDGFCAMEMT